MIRPSLVEQAIVFSETLGFKSSCLEEVGRLLHVLVGHVQRGRIAEIGTGCGVSTAWIASATSNDIFTVDHDDTKASGLQELFGGYENVHPMFADWEDVLQEGPFQFVFVDAKPAKLEGMDKVVNATEVGGLIVLDDLTPIEFWPDEWKEKSDEIRDLWLHDSRLATVEIRTSLKASVLLARRISS